MNHYAQINESNTVISLLESSTPPGAGVPQDLIPLSESQDVALGDIYDPMTQSFTRPAPQPVLLTLPEVSSTQLSQQISDLEAQLVISGVI